MGGLLTVYLFQHFNLAGVLGVVSPTGTFVLNKTARFLANDFLMIGLLYALFYERKYVIFALWVQLTGLLLFLVPYFILKLVFYTGNGPLISFFHRVIINPVLLLLLIPAFYYQRLKE